MLLSDFTVVPSEESVTRGQVTGSGSYSYEIYGPFGQGYNIRVSGFSGSAQLSYNWRDSDIAAVQSPSGNFGMTETVVRGGKKSDVILQLSGDRMDSSLTDGLLLSMFVVNHHYASRTGPFIRPSGTAASGA